MRFVIGAPAEEEHNGRTTSGPPRARGGGCRRGLPWRPARGGRAAPGVLWSSPYPLMRSATFRKFHPSRSYAAAGTDGLCQYEQVSRVSYSCKYSMKRLKEMSLVTGHDDGSGWQAPAVRPPNRTTGSPSPADAPSCPGSAPRRSRAKGAPLAEDDDDRGNAPDPRPGQRPSPAGVAAAPCWTCPGPGAHTTDQAGVSGRCYRPSAAVLSAVLACDSTQTSPLDTQRDCLEIDRLST